MKKSLSTPEVSVKGFNVDQLRAIADFAHAIWNANGHDMGENVAVASIVDYIADTLYDAANSQCFHTQTFRFNSRCTPSELRNILLNWRGVKWETTRGFYKAIFSTGADAWIKKALMPTISEAKQTLRIIGISLTRIVETNEYRVNLRNGTEATAYYTNDIEDAIDTGRYMAKFRDDEKARQSKNRESFKSMMAGAE